MPPSNGLEVRLVALEAEIKRLTLELEICKARLQAPYIYPTPWPYTTWTITASGATE